MSGLKARKITFPPFVPAMMMLRMSIGRWGPGVDSLGDLPSSAEVEHGDTDATNLPSALNLAHTLRLTFLSDLDWPEGVIPVVYSP